MGVWVEDVGHPRLVESSPKPFAWITNLSCSKRHVQYKQAPVGALWYRSKLENYLVKSMTERILLLNTRGHMDATEKHNYNSKTRKQKLFIIMCSSVFLHFEQSIPLFVCVSGIVSSNTRDLAARVTYPHLNFSIPVTVFQALLQKFLQTMDINVFKVLNTSKKEVRQVWRLQGQQSKL